MADPKKTRLPEYDLLRIFAAFLVVLLHVSGSRFYWVPYDSTDWAVMNAYDSLCRSAVPLFFMLSGVFMLKKEIPLKKLWLQKILPLAGIWAFWAGFYGVHQYLAGELTNWVEVVKTAAKGHYHLWFLPAMIGLYILQPVLRALVHFEKGRIVPYYLACFGIFGILRSTLLQFTTNSQTATALLQKIPVELMQYAGYMVLGYALAHFGWLRIRKRWCALGYLAVTAASALVTQWDTLRIGKAGTLLYGYFSLTVFLEAVFIFLWFRGLLTRKEGFFYKGWVQKLSGLTMGIYLMHPWLMSLLKEHFRISVASFSPVLSIPVLSLAVFGLAALLSWLISKIPFVKLLIKG